MASGSARAAPWLSALAGAILGLTVVSGVYAPALVGVGALMALAAVAVGRGRGLWGLLIGAGLTASAIWALAIVWKVPICQRVIYDHPYVCRFTPALASSYWDAIALFVIVALVGAAIPLVARLTRRERVSG